ncbi:4-hydroxythreonine-4-phosphate dehydrogenase [gut metagenome]|uniref:4-hydroxythreonine-4-phosphate dehydrogenase n=1 Tax=gut metagenome TaxID=749906 RepID=J9GYZ1_9ZZZZ
MPLPVAITTGEPAGIGPEISLKAALSVRTPVCLIGSYTLLEERAKRFGIAWPLPSHVSIDNIDLPSPATLGKLSTENASYVLNTLKRAHEGALQGRWSAIVTAPVQKSVIIEAGFPFTGHTEYFQQLCGVPRVVMMLTANHTANCMKVALATTHLPIASLSSSITGPLLDEVIRILCHALQTDYRIDHPSILITGLNPHAGENGHLGREEIEIIAPAVQRARQSGIDITGPVPADTAFIPGHWDRYDAVLCMYHDQGLPVLKHVGFNSGVNVTLGLPYVRTSVDHGTALDIAEQGIANIDSMLSALQLAHFLSTNRETRMA